MTYRHMLNFWPLVPAVDIQSVYKDLKSNSLEAMNDNNANNEEYNDTLDAPTCNTYQKEHSSLNTPTSVNKKDMNILIIGNGVGCLIKTLARMYRHEAHNLNIYFVSNFTEHVVRKFLLLSLFDRTLNMGTLEKAEMFLEIFGNIYLRTSTSVYIETKCASILDDIFHLKQPLKTFPIVSLVFLKQSEIDEICNIIFYLKLKDCSYNIAKAWENALRSYFGTRYDCRKNLFDYQFNLKLSQYPIINLRKYVDWCETGNAFKLRKGKYDNPNKTLRINCSATKTKSDELHVGDISTSPYIAFGVECENEALFTKANNQFCHTSEDISKFNIIDFMTEFSASPTDKKVNVFPLFYATFCKMRKFKKFFDAIYITCDMTNYADNGSLINLLSKGGIVVFETMNNVVNSTKDRKVKHAEEIDRLAKINGLKVKQIFAHEVENFKTYIMGDDVAKKD